MYMGCAWTHRRGRDKPAVTTGERSNLGEIELKDTSCSVQNRQATRLYERDKQL